MNNIKAVIFDLDNTILDRTITFNKFAMTFAAKYFPHLNDRENIIRRIIELDEDGYKNRNKLFEELVEELPWNKKPKSFELLKYFDDHFVSNASIMEHAREVIQITREKYKIGIITNGRSKIQYGKIEQLGIRNLFDFIIVSEEAGFQKPNVRIFELAIEGLGMRPEECLYIGDHPINDIEGAGMAGMETIWIEVNHPWKTEITIKPKHKIKRLSDLVGIL
ncbi:HAD family hydrolase [Paenibacillus sp. HB172176]|uniref:HAD family hydrolase n=1 Tax=Paenibacillus sp. HB172176 TaxID=2493690 RepID=UPI00143BF8B9|nr:HAD family hydrolase [Paenibacillus sp. HB172176]